MDHSTPPPAQPNGENAGYEHSDIAIRPILYFLIGLVVFGGLVQGAMTIVMQGFVKQDTKVATLPSDILQDTGNIGSAPLQKDTTGDMLRMYAQEDDILNTYKVDPTTKEIRVPLDRAIQILAKKGLPTRPDAPKMDPSKDLPYPTRSKAYQATR